MKGDCRLTLKGSSSYISVAFDATGDYIVALSGDLVSNEIIMYRYRMSELESLTPLNMVEENFFVNSISRSAGHSRGSSQYQVTSMNDYVRHKSDSSPSRKRIDWGKGIAKRRCLKCKSREAE